MLNLSNRLPNTTSSISGPRIDIQMNPILNVEMKNSDSQINLLMLLRILAVGFVMKRVESWDFVALSSFKFQNWVCICCVLPKIY